MKYFRPEEFTCDGAPAIDHMSPILLQMLDNLRGKLGVPLKITSSYRTPAYNQKVGGEPNSAHLRGYAVDIEALGGVIKYKLITEALKMGITRIGVGKTFVHLDIDPALPHDVIWTY